MGFVAVLVLLSAAVGVIMGQCAAEDSDLADRLSRVEVLLHKLEKENQRLKSDNQELFRGLSQIRAENEKLKTENQNLRGDVEALKTETVNLKVALWETNPAKNHRDRTDEFTIPSKKVQAMKVGFSSGHPIGTKTQSHDIATRADDENSLQPVVNQLTQEVGEVKADIQVLKNVDQQHSQAIQHAATSTYTRWGHSACPTSNTLVYSGVVGGSWWQDSGAAANYLCLTLSPVPSSHNLPPYYANLHGAEYQTYDSHLDKNPVCAVCLSPHPNIVMIPGTNRCTSGWTLEYSGYLMAGRNAHVAASEYVCVDSAMLSSNAGNNDENGVLFFYTIARCGSLPCEPYVNDKVVTCAVCSQ